VTEIAEVVDAMFDIADAVDDLRVRREERICFGEKVEREMFEKVKCGILKIFFLDW